MNTLFGLLIVIVIVGMASVFIIWIVSKLRLGLEVDGLINAFIPTVLIAVVGGILTLIASLWGRMDSAGYTGGLIYLVISAVILVICGKLISAIRIRMYTGVLLAAIAIGAFYWLGGQLLARIIML